jgi:gamma-glutamylcysteine synthetase
MRPSEARRRAIDVGRPDRARRLDAGVAALAEAFAARFPERARRPRLVGREAELPLVDASGRAGDSTPLWQALLDATRGAPTHDASGPLIGVELPRWFCLAEVGRGTIELGVGPRRSLPGLERDLRPALATVGALVAGLGCRLLGHGIQPRTPFGPHLLTPKARYEALARETGLGWLRWTVTASDQLHVDVGRDDLARAMNVVNGCSGALIALCANSGVYGGRAGAASGREVLSARVSGEPFRNGAVPRRFADAEDYVRWTIGFRALVLPDGRGGFEHPGVTYADRLAERGPDLDEWLYHEHYLWPSARPRARLSTLEIRPGCQQPGASFAAAALSLGLVEANEELDAYLEERFPGAAGWRRLLAYRRRAVQAGLGAAEPAPGFLATVVDLAGAALARRGLGEEPMLDGIRARLVRRRGPADDAWDVLRRDGMPALIHALALPYR